MTFNLLYNTNMPSSVYISLIEPVLLIIVLAFMVVFVYFGITLVHHWNFYSFNIQIKRMMQGLYFFVSGMTMLLLLFFIGLYIFGYGI
jgi:hypothetical protein